jgi:hypothetical protein
VECTDFEKASEMEFDKIKPFSIEEKNAEKNGPAMGIL